MGHAAYARGSRAISIQIQRDLEASRLVPVDHQYLTAVEGQRDALRIENAALRAKLARTELHLRERRATLTVERRDREKEREQLLLRAHEAEHAMLRYLRAWQWVSRILRLSASPSAVLEARSFLAEEGERLAKRDLGQYGDTLEWQPEVEEVSRG